jgi:uncharacterized membrane-anchored protein YjiN (DUF445 family)
MQNHLNREQARAQIAALDEEQKARALRRTKAVATGALVLCVLVFLAARALQPQYPALAYLAAFAEAAAIGGIADWYAVVALFRRPMGLPIPHTAIIPRNKEKIADNLGRFIEGNFLKKDVVDAKLREVDFARLVADWLSDRRHAQDLARFVTRMTPQALAALEKSNLRAFLGKRVVERLETIDIAPVAAELLAGVTAERRHQRLFDGLLIVLNGILNDEKTLGVMRDRIRAELPTLANIFRADAYLLNKIVASAGRLVEEAGSDPDHPLRREFDAFALRFIEDLKTDPAYVARAERIKANLLARPELAHLADEIWKSVSAFLAEDAQAPDSIIRIHLASMFIEIGQRLAEDDAIRADMNAGFAVALSSFVEEQKTGVATFIADQVKAWDIAQTSRLIELNIGRDLQYIRFNGMIIGGLAGLLLHIGERAIFGG